MRITPGFICLLLASQLYIFSNAAIPDVSPQCVTRFSNGEAVPGTESCFINALSSPATLANFSCGAEEAREYCGCPAGSLPDFDTGECIELCPTGTVRNSDTNECEPIQCEENQTQDPVTLQCIDDEECPEGQVLDLMTGQCITDNECPAGQTLDPATGQCVSDDQCPDGQTRDPVTGQCSVEDCPMGASRDPVTGQCDTTEQEECPVGQWQNSAGQCITSQNCEWGLQDYETGSCPDRPGLQDYQETTTECTEADLIDTLPGPIAFLLQGTPNLSSIGNIGSVLQSVSLTQAVQHAAETGDTRPFYEAVYDIVFPLIPGDGPLRDTFIEFSNFVDTLSGSGC